MTTSHWRLGDLLALGIVACVAVPVNDPAPAPVASARAPYGARSGGLAVVAADTSEGVVNVRAFGAVPNARVVDRATGKVYVDSSRSRPATDNTSAFQDAINSLMTADPQTSGGILFIPKGHYMVGPLFIPDPGRVQIRGTGVTSVLVLKPGSNEYLLTIASSYTTTANVMFDCNRGGQTQGGCLKLLNTAHYTRVQDARFAFAKDYALYTQGGGQQTFDNVQFLNSGGGAYSRFNTPINFVNGTNFEDNDSVGLRIVGGRYNSLVNVQGAYFENNGTATRGTAFHIEATDVGNASLGAGGTQILRITGSYFNGNRSASHQAGIYIAGPGVSGWEVHGNEFRDLDAGAFVIPSHPVGTVGTNDLRGNIYVGSTPPPWKDTDRVDRYGYLTEVGFTETTSSHVDVADTASSPVVPGQPGSAGVRVDRLRLSCAPSSGSAVDATVRIGSRQRPDLYYVGKDYVGASGATLDLAPLLQGQVAGPGSSTLNPLYLRLTASAGAHASCQAVTTYTVF